jgi:ketosteroid isomerase-like protein
MMAGGADTLDGRRYDQTYCQIFRVEQGTIREIWEFFDTMQAEARLFGNSADPGTEPDDPLRF